MSEAEIWAQFFAAAMASGPDQSYRNSDSAMLEHYRPNATDCAKVADDMLEQFKKRYDRTGAEKWVPKRT